MKFRQGTEMLRKMNYPKKSIFLKGVHYSAGTMLPLFEGDLKKDLKEVIDDPEKGSHFFLRQEHGG